MTYDCTSFISCKADLPGPSLAEMCGASTFLVFMSILDELVRSNDKISGACERVVPIEDPDKEYDFVVIGGGGSGAVAAGRLSENPCWKVLVLEAGSDEPAGGQIPLFMKGLLGTKVDWQYVTTNESNGCLSGNGSCALASGKMLGGSTSHNSMVYSRGIPTDYDNWAAEGNIGWTWDEVKPFFLKSEDNQEINRVGRYHHATGGPLPVQRFPYQPKFVDSILAAAAEAGFNISDDLNGDQFTGFSITQTTTKNGVRRSSAAAFLRPARNRKNLHVSLDSLATRVMMKNHRAVGVEYYKNGELKRVRVTREVVISASALRSPQILLLSGIGPKEHLESMGVKVVKDLPGVGKNFHNQVGYLLKFTINETDEYDNDYDIAAQYMVNQTGPLSGLGLVSVIATLSTKFTSPEFPDLALYFLGYNATCAPGKVGALRSTGKRTVTLWISNLHPKSRGRISLASKDPHEYPIIWANYLSDSSDVEVIIEGIKKAFSLAKTRALRAHDFTLSNTAIEVCSDHKFLSDAYWTCAMRQETEPLHHFAGSCKMGPSSDPLAVVDPELRVHGIKGLRVADTSIMPMVTSGSTAAPAMMIGERVADFIKKYWDQINDEQTCSYKH